MATAAVYHQYAREAVQSASKAKTEIERQHFLSMARTWTEAALRVEGVVVPIEESNPFPPVAD
jgi:hypothetical protein